jgi:hypothetical protein
MGYQYWLWIAVFCYGLHIMEEYVMDWKNWAVQTIHLPVEWNNFYITNAIVIAIGISCAQVGWFCPIFALIYPALMIINAILFHIIPTIKSRVYSPGVVTGIILFLPVGTLCFYYPYKLNIIGVYDIVVAFILGFILMMYPVVLLRIARKIHIDNKK